MDDETEDQMIAKHDRNTKIIAEAVAGLFEKFAPLGLTPVAIFEGAVKGAAWTMIARNGLTRGEVAELLEEAADALRAMNEAPGGALPN